MKIKELVEFMQWTIGEGRYKHTMDFSDKERILAQMIKIGEDIENYQNKFHEFCEHKE